MAYTIDQLKEALIRPGHIDESSFEEAAAEAEHVTEELENILIKKGLIKISDLGQVLANLVGAKYLDVRSVKVDEKVFSEIPEPFARKNEVIAVSATDDQVLIGMTDLDDRIVVRRIEDRFGKKAEVRFITKSDLAEALKLYKTDLKDEFEETARRMLRASDTQEERNRLSIKLVDTLIEYAHDAKASDIHIEPYREQVVIRFRIDGIMHTVAKIQKPLLATLITRIKILSKMRTDEHLAAQDGKFQYSSGHDKIDIRVSTVPVTEGENAVLRLLSASVREMSLETIGFSTPDLKKVKEAIRNPHGMILVTGPTGSGKTTTIYELLKVLNTKEVHIASIEDPVEYDIEGVSQIQVNSKTNLSFANGLRAIVRQDPDIIFIGEIRDQETAEIAVNSAMTGHLVLSTLHANDAVTTMPRLIDMDVEPFLLASTVNVILSQRLVRQICMKCRYSCRLEDEEVELVKRSQFLLEAFKKYGKQDLAKIYVFKSKGCKVCAGTGYQGRLGIFEVLTMDEILRDLVVKGAASNSLLKEARNQGMATMLEDGILKVLNGNTTLSEVVRVTEIN